MKVASGGEVEEAVRELQIETGKPVDVDASSDDKLKRTAGGFIESEDHDEVLSFLEILLEEIWTPSSNDNPSHEELLDLDSKIRRILFEEGILLQVQPDREYVETRRIEILEGAKLRKTLEQTVGPLEPTEYDHFRFERLTDETVIEADQAIRALAKEERWGSPLEPYNEAWEMYQDGQFTYVIAEKLYNSLEAVLTEICVSEGWNDPEEGVGDYLDSLREHGLFEPNDAMVGEWEQILGGIRVGVQRTGSDRKRHDWMDQDYAILLIHQVAAFLTFIINRYEDQFE